MIEPHRFDLIVDGSGGHTFNSLIGLLKWGGKLVTYGSTAGIPKKLDIHRIFLSQLQIIGTTM